MSDLDADGLPPAPRSLTCGAVLAPEPMASATRVVIAYACPVHGAVVVVDPFQ